MDSNFHHAPCVGRTLTPNAYLQFYIILLLAPSFYLSNLFEPTNGQNLLVSGEIDEVAKSNIVYSHDMSKQKAAVKAWSRSLSENDYNASEWARFDVSI